MDPGAALPDHAGQLVQAVTDPSAETVRPNSPPPAVPGREFYRRTAAADRVRPINASIHKIDENVRRARGPLKTFTSVLERLADLWHRPTHRHRAGRILSDRMRLRLDAGRRLGQGTQSLESAGWCCGAGPATGSGREENRCQLAVLQRLLSCGGRSATRSPPPT